MQTYLTIPAELDDATPLSINQDFSFCIITVPKIKLSKLLEIRVAIPYPGLVHTASINQAINQAKSIFKVEGVPYPENAREKDDAKTLYFKLVTAEAFLREDLPGAGYSKITYERALRAVKSNLDKSSVSVTLIAIPKPNLRSS